MSTGAQIERWKAQRLQEWRRRVDMHDQPRLAAVTAALVGQGHTLDDEETQRRWTFNKRGELIATQPKASVITRSPNLWVAGLRNEVHI